MINDNTPNAFDILTKVKINMKLAWMSKHEVDLKFSELFDKATVGDYETLIESCAEWLDVELIKEELDFV